ncbi:hypothetical protein ACET3Z_009912 [Daucus carota]
MENEKILENKIDEEEMEEELDDEFYETVKFLLMIIDAILTVLRDYLSMMHEPIRRSLTRRPVTRIGTDDQLSDTDDDINELNLLSQQQQREEANNWRAGIANSMWNNRPSTTTNEEEENNEEGDEEEEDVH